MSEDRDIEVRRRAYEIWKAEGEPQGEELKHWFQASQEFGNEGADSATPEDGANASPPDHGSNAATADGDPNSAIKKERAKEREAEQPSDAKGSVPKQAAE